MGIGARVRKIFLMSPREPSGATWLINCFLELGIKTYRESTDGMWRRSRKGYVLNSHEEILKKWLPSLWEKDYFSFRNDVEIQWSHEWPTEIHYRHKVIYFVRDPRDSLYSRYKRESPDQSFEEFIDFPDVNTLLNKIDNWRLFNLSWLEHPDQKVCRFEDYKQDAGKVLMEVLDYIGLKFASADIERAVKASTYESAAAAEARYKNDRPEDNELINRGGKAGEWKQGHISQTVVARIQNECSDVMHMFGYLPADKAPLTDYSKLISSLPFMQRLKLPPKVMENKYGHDPVPAALGFARSLSVELLTRSKLKSYEISCLLESCESLTQALRFDASPAYADLRKVFQPASMGLLGKIKKGVANRFLKKVGLYTTMRRLYRSIKLWKPAK